MTIPLFHHGAFVVSYLSVWSSTNFHTAVQQTKMLREKCFLEYYRTNTVLLGFNLECCYASVNQIILDVTL